MNVCVYIHTRVINFTFFYPFIGDKTLLVYLWRRKKEEEGESENSFKSWEIALNFLETFQAILVSESTAF